jgi:hypothetical protein
VSVRGENALVRVTVTRIAQDGTMQRRLVDTARFDDSLQWERLAASAVETPPPYHAVPGIPIFHVCVGGQVVLVAEYDLDGPLLDLVTAVMALGEEVLARYRPDATTAAVGPGPLPARCLPTVGDTRVIRDTTTQPVRI